MLGLGIGALPDNRVLVDEVTCAIGHSESIYKSPRG